MSQETSEWLNTNTLIGFTDQRGNAWHYRMEDQGAESNHYPGPVPIEDVRRRLFHFEVRDSAVCIPTGETQTVYRQEKTDKGGMRYVPTESPIYMEIPNRKAMVRADNQEVFGIFRDGYCGHDYSEWLLDNVVPILGGDTGLDIGSAGLLKKGAVAWVSVEVPESIKTPEGVEFRPHLLAVTSYDGTIATTFKRVVQNVVCDNTLSAGLSESGQTYKVRHSKFSGLKIGEAREALAIVEHTATDFATEVRRLTSIKVEMREFDLLLDALMPINEDGLSKKANTMNTSRRESIRALYLHDERAAQWNGTAFGVLQAFNTYDHHESIIRAKTNRAEKNMLAAINGAQDERDASVMKVLAGIVS